MSDFERRLGALAPREDGLSPDAMLYAAGMAAARPRRARFVWPAAAAGLAILAAGLGYQLGLERQARRALVAELHAAKRTPTALVSPALAEPAPTEDHGTDTLLSSHRLLIDGLGELRSASAALPSAAGAVGEITPLRAWPLRSSPDL